MDNDINPWYIALALTCAILAAILLWGRRSHEVPLRTGLTSGPKHMAQVAALASGPQSVPTETINERT